MSRPTTAQRQLEQAASLAQAERFDLAIPRYRRLVKQFPGEPELGIQLTHALGLAGRRHGAAQQQQRLLDQFGRLPELLVRFARNHNQWQDFEGSLALWEELYQVRSTWRADAAFYRVRLNERLNRVERARECLKEAQQQSLVGEGWGWLWIEGVLAHREGDLDRAEELYCRAESHAADEHKPSCRSALARLADGQGDFKQAVEHLSELRKLRREEAQAMQQLTPLRSEPEPPPKTFPKQTEDQAQLIFLTGFPRSGTSLLARLCEQSFDLRQSDEYSYASHAIGRLQAFGKRYPSPDQILSRPARERQASLDAYWRAQGETLGIDFGQGDILLDKNPSLALLSPWLLALIPGLRILWVERNPRDLWLSSVMVDVPINRTSCWWQEPKDYLRWYRLQKAQGKQLEECLGTERFQRVDYADLVGDSQAVLQRLGSKWGLALRSEGVERPVIAAARSPSYVEVEKEVGTARLKRWDNYRDLLSDEERRLFEEG